MFNNGSPKKRRNCESASEINELTSGSKRPRQNISPSTEKTGTKTSMARIHEIIKREFSHEMKLKETQLDQIDDRLEEAHSALNRLRYAIVAEYYKKQEQPQLMIEATKMLQNTATSSKNPNDVQIAMHPSLKKIIGKRPTNLEEIMKANPKRAAAQNAKHGISSTTAAKRKVDRIQQKPSNTADQVKINIKQKTDNTATPSTLCRLEAPSSYKFNSYRNANKTKHLFVVGNTSKYISNADSKVLGNISLTHKWLVYVQTKDTEVAISKYITKVRFFLHPSYRPNDIIDVHAPPFQVARRGWGEFPMRIQLFFHDRFQQKPIQLIHRVVLDTSKSGRHTLGAETVMEVWLRDEQISHNRHIKREETVKQTKNCSSNDVTTKVPQSSLLNKPGTISLASIKEPFDDNFMEFLNKIDETRTSICADIEKIQPTVMVNESLEPKLTNVLRSPLASNETKSPIKMTPTPQSPYRTRSASANAQTKSSCTIPKPIKDANRKLEEVVRPAVISQIEPQDQTKMSAEKPLNTLSTPNKAETTKSHETQNLLKSQPISVSNTLKTDVESTSSGKVFSNVSGTVILPVTKPPQEIRQQNISGSSDLNNLAPKTIFQKKTVKVIDAQGKVKTVQVLVATSNKFSSNLTSALSSKLPSHPTNHSTNVASEALSKKPSSANLITTKPIIVSLASNVTTSKTISVAKAMTPMQNKTLHVDNVSSKNTPTSTNAAKNLVFQKEGKLYIIDPLQIKLKQQQKNQVSLLKPQVKLQNNIAETIATDHDYVPSPERVQKIVPPTDRQQEMARSLLNTTQFHSIGKRNMHTNVLKEQDLLRLRKIQFEKRFHRLKFCSMRSAVEYLLRRLPLNVFDKESSSAAFPFACLAPNSFCNLTAFKQRSCEWLRAKFIARMLRSLETLQKLDSSKAETFWSTREIAVFARHFAYTPLMKSFPDTSSMVLLPFDEATNVKSKTDLPTSQTKISQLIKEEMQNNHLQVEYDSLSPISGMLQWVESMQQQLKQRQEILNEEEIVIIDVESDCDNGRNRDHQAEKTRSKEVITKRIFGSPSKIVSEKNTSFLPQLVRLETAHQFVGEICKEFSIRLEPEEIVPGVVHPAAQTLLAHTLKVFVDRLLRQAIANQVHQTEKQQPKSTFVNYFGLSTVDRCLTSQDIRKVIVESNELDFLTNRHLGISNVKIQHD